MGGAAMIEVTRLRPEHARHLFGQVARMHVGTIHHGLLPQMGLDFLTRVYRAVADSRHGFVIAALADETVVGFVAGSTSMHRMYANVLWREGPRLLAAAGVQVLRKALWKRIWDVLSYPLRPKATGGPSAKGGAELLAIAVHQDARRNGLGARLLRAFEDEIRKRNGGTVYTVATNVAEVASNRFYVKMGLRPTGRMTHHQLVLQLYAKKL